MGVGRVVFKRSRFWFFGCVDAFHRSYFEAIVGDYPRCLAGDIGPGTVRDFVQHRETLQ